MLKSQFGSYKFTSETLFKQNFKQKPYLNKTLFKQKLYLSKNTLKSWFKFKKVENYKFKNILKKLKSNIKMDKKYKMW